MKARIVRIGNSRGLRLPKVVIEQAGLPDEVELEVKSGAVIIRPANGPRAGWAQAAARLARTHDGLLDEPTTNRFDESEWNW